MKRIKIVFPCLFVALLLGQVAGCGRSEKSADVSGGTSAGSTQLVRVTPIRPERKTLVRWTDQPGRIEAFEETPLFAKLAGFVEKMHVDIGDVISGPQFDKEGKLIREGQLLVELSVPELDEEYLQKQAQVRQTQAEVRQAVAAIQVAKSAARSARAKVVEAEAVIKEAQADYEFAHSEFVRLKELAKRGASAREVAEEKDKQLQAADSRREQTQAKVDSAKAKYDESQSLIEKAEADRHATEAKLEVAEADAGRVQALLSYTKIRAPYDAVVSARNVHTGHLVQPGAGSGGKPLLVVVQSRVMRVFVDVPDIDAALLSLGSEVQVRFPPTALEMRTGTVTRTAWSLDSGSRTLRTEIDIANEDGKLRPGMYAHARLKVAERQNALALPKSAVFTAEGQTYCCTIGADDKIVRTRIDTGIRAGDEIEIVSGLTGDEAIIGVNAPAFREGQQVEIVIPKIAER